MKWLKKLRSTSSTNTSSIPPSTNTSTIPVEITVNEDESNRELHIDANGIAKNENVRRSFDHRPSVSSIGTIGSIISATGHQMPRCVPSVKSDKKPIQDPLLNKLDLFGMQSTTPTEVSSSVQELATTESGKCPYRHGTVYAGPYPGYPHGSPKRGICPNGCRATLNADITRNESPKDTLLREALEYIELYYHERGDDMHGKTGFISKEKRMDMVKQSIKETGTYEHTFDELQHGARIAWRNAPKCANRKYWQQLKLLDCRDVNTNKGMFDSCMHHLQMATSSGATEAYISVFKPKHPGEADGPRIWNEQLLQYASYNTCKGDGKQGEVIGDAKNLRFTEMLTERFGWTGPPDGKQGHYDYLPLVIQADPNKPPEMFEVPLEVAPPVHIHHPQYPELSSLNMQWYPVPAVSALDLTLGGILYTAVPFNGWYASTEVLRDLTDESRYNMLVPVAKVLGMETNTKPGDAPLWIDDCMAILSKAVFHSFKTSKIAMIDHHNLINMFWEWYHNELKSRRYCPVNWKWVIPPMSSSTSPAYLGLNKAQEFTLKPAYIVGKGFLSLEERHFGPRDRTKAIDDLIRTMYLALLFKRMISRYRIRKQPILIIYASVTGNAASYAYDLGAILSSSCNVNFFDACGVNASKDGKVLSMIESSTLTIFVSSTQGNGELPSLARKFFTFLLYDNGHVLAGKQVAVLGFGSSAYPIFCGGAAEISRQLSASRAKEVVTRGECDAVKGESPTFYKWTSKLVKTLASSSSASPLMRKLSEDLKQNSNVKVKRSNIIDYIKVDVFTANEVSNAAAAVFMRRKSSKVLRRNSSAYQRRSSNSSAMGEETNTLNRRSSVGSSFTEDEEDSPRKQLTMSMISGSESTKNVSEDVLIGQVIDRTDLIGSSEYNDDGEEMVTRKTSLVKISLDSCGNPPYQPGDHVQVFPRNVVSISKLQSFLDHLSGDDLSLDSQMHVSFTSEDISSSELAVAFPLLSENLNHMISLDYFFEKQAAILAPISMQACLELSEVAPEGKDKKVLHGLSKSASEYERMNSLSGMKWIDLFKTFPSLSKRVSMSFLLCNMKMNHPRSYSISSCKAIVGSELHLCVGRFIYSRGGSHVEAGICSNFLTSVDPGDEVHFKIESAPSFHHPLDPSCPIILICTGTGVAPIRGLLQKRSYFKSRGERLGPCFFIYGSRNSEEGLLHDELKAFQEEGVITKTWMCYSRERGKPKEYTADKLGSDRLKKLLAPILGKPNTHIFICGSANMAEQSKAMLKEISSKGTIANVSATGRLHCDVFGALSSSAAKKKRNINPRTKKPLSMSVVATTNKSSRSLDHCEDLMESDRSGQSDDPLTLEELLEENCLDSSFRRSKAIKKNRRATLANNKSKSMVGFESESKRKNLAELLDTDSVS